MGKYVDVISLTHVLKLRKIEDVTVNLWHKKRRRRIL